VTSHVPHDLRAVTTPDEYLACAALQRDIWGAGFQAAPADVLHASAQVGGIVAGAFTPEGALAGFVFGLTGFDASGTLIHWSHILGVRPEFRDVGVGRALKEFQRRELVRRGIAHMYWTYDPLIAKNAHLNLNVLGARVVRFLPNMYGSSDSPLHHGLPTHRCVVVVDTVRPVGAGTIELGTDDCDTPVLSPLLSSGETSVTKQAMPSRLRLEIPTDFAQLLIAAPERAKTWHAAVGDDFQWALGNGYAVTGLRRDPETSRSFYILERRR
jgi:predicted GNAT superfamily acetyltransferase